MFGHQKELDRVWALVHDLNLQLSFFHQIGRQMAEFELEKVRIDADKHREIAKTALALGDGVIITEEKGEVGAKYGQRQGHTRRDLNAVNRDART